MKENRVGEFSAYKYHWAEEEKILLLKPYLKAIGKTKNKKILDIGCGSGWITEMLGKDAKEVTGIDISNDMIGLAKKQNKNKRIHYKILDAVNVWRINDIFDTITCAFTLQLISPYKKMIRTLKGVNKILRDKGSFIVLAPHPCFSDRNKRKYNSYKFLKEFNYFKQEQKYKVRILSNKGKSEHISNFYSLQGYFNAFKKAGFIVSGFIEPGVTNRDKKKYPKMWSQELKIPFYLIIKLKKLKTVGG